MASAKPQSSLGRRSGSGSTMTKSRRMRRTQSEVEGRVQGRMAESRQRHQRPARPGPSGRRQGGAASQEDEQPQEKARFKIQKEF
ncbi:hypothetical protein Nepgr_021649 [Nepenthes gracilis]|uniref:Uncharacterized protein n=1 Tax=Nepenthes gracilis TaxID=150966 RepID=A0AAD3SYL9_NEPGR|nr:hypothetical protein Nepgr_021649 [Nepenthes gracilis]